MSDMKQDDDWTPGDSTAAIAQGWEIFSTDRDPGIPLMTADGKRYGHRPFELQAVDEMNIFKDDHEAWRFVKNQALSGDQLALKALSFLLAKSPEEHIAIVLLDQRAFS